MQIIFICVIIKKSREIGFGEGEIGYATIEERIHSFVKRALSVQHRKKIVRTVTRSDVVALNKVIEPKYARMKENVLLASMHAAVCCIVGGR